MKLYKLLAILTGIGIILFWTLFFTVGMAPEKPPKCYFAYEYAFPVPDIILSIALIFGAIKHERTLIGASGGLVFLGLLDMSFNIQNGVYKSSTFDFISNGFINLWCIIFGLYILYRKR